jgi:prepilin-type processing-associated H-X9-DG protein
MLGNGLENGLSQRGIETAKDGLERRTSMKTIAVKSGTRGITFIEVLVSIGVILILAVIFLPTMTHHPGKSMRIACVSNLKQIGLGFRLYSNDNKELFPWNVPPPVGAQGLSLVEYFRIASNEFNTPKILVCPSDPGRKKAVRWDELTTNHLSYFVGLDASEIQPQTILSGDRHITGGTWTNNRVMLFAPGVKANWMPNNHNGNGNIGMGDGSAMQVTAQGLNKQIEAALQYQSNNPVLRLALP